MILGILQARVSSTRLPGKVLKLIVGKPMLALQLERLQRVTQLDKLLVATSVDASDDAIEALCRDLGVDCARGSLDDVLDRFYQAARGLKPDHVVRLTGDCPLADPKLIDQLITFHLQGGYEYSSNCLHPSYPDGLDAEVCNFACLEQAWQEAVLPSQREHVLPFLHQQPQRFRIGSLFGDQDLSGLRWTVDEQPDFELVSYVYETLYPATPDFTTADVLDLFAKDPRLGRLNSHLTRNTGMQSSLVLDGIHLTERAKKGPCD